MIIGRSNTNSRSNFAFTASQWQELEQQLLTFKYIMSGVPIPPQLFSTVITNPVSSSSSCGLFPHQQFLPFGWGCFQVGYGRKIDPEPGRCRRTDGKKWRCSKEASPESKYCERHMHRGKNKTKKNLQVFPKTTNNNTLLSTSPAITCSVSSSHDPISYHPMAHKTLVHTYPFLSPQSSSPSFSTNCTQSTQISTAPLWLLDPHTYDDQPQKEMRYLNQMKGAETENILGPFQDIGLKNNHFEKEQRFGVYKEDVTQKLFHYLGDWSKKDHR